MSEPHPALPWWSLHLRNARGERLTDDERVVYEAGLRDLERSETFPRDVEAMRHLRAELTRLKAECAELRAREAELDRQIAELEAALPPEVRTLLGIDLPPNVQGSEAEVARLSEEAVREVDQWERQE